MIAFKGVTNNMESRLGNKRIKFEVGKTYTETKAKTARSGFHCCENPIECLSYYSLTTDRFFMVEAGGDIDEDEHERISCTEITFIRELNMFEFAFECMKYIVKHPKRDWEHDTNGIMIARDKASAERIAIAVGENPVARVSAVDGIIGLIVEKDGEFVQASYNRVTKGGDLKKNVFYKISEEGIEAADNEKSNNTED